MVSVALDAPPPDAGQFQIAPARPAAAIGGGWPGCGGDVFPGLHPGLRACHPLRGFKSAHFFNS
ncbi:MAG: hypothetical protein HY774_08395 [Acidobacteria bacterium]|nr:hypothetical protein [Acidobacteriota bacterium]